MIRERLGERNIIAEDLGYMTDSVRKLVKDSGYPNMKVLEFAFDSRDSSGKGDYLPHNYEPTASLIRGRMTMRRFWAGFPASKNRRKP